MANKIQFRRGLKSKLPTLAVGEPALTTDTKEIFVGHADGNIGVATTSQLAAMSTKEDLANGLKTKPTNQSLYNLNGYGFPKFTKYASNPVVQGNTQTQNQAGYCSVICTDGIITAPIDKFYMYWAGHDGGGIWMSTAPHPLGPWTTHGQIIKDVDMYPNQTDYNNTPGAHISSPEIIYVPELNVIRMYFHRYTLSGQLTEYAHSTNGLAWTKQSGEITKIDWDGSWVENELSYFRVCKLGEVYYGTFQGRDTKQNVKGMAFGISNDGVKFDWSRVPLFYNTQFKDEYDPMGDIGGAPALLNLKGQLWLFFGDGNVTRTIKASPLTNPFERHPLVKTILAPTETWEAGKLESPNFLYHEDHLYMYFNGQTSTLERSIGVSYFKLEV